MEAGFPPSPSLPGVSQCGARALCLRGRGRLKAQWPSQCWGGGCLAPLRGGSDMGLQGALSSAHHIWGNLTQ